MLTILNVINICLRLVVNHLVLVRFNKIIKVTVRVYYNFLKIKPKGLFKPQVLFNEISSL